MVIITIIITKKLGYIGNNITHDTSEITIFLQKLYNSCIPACEHGAANRKVYPTH